MVIVNDVFVRFTIMKYKYVLTTLLYITLYDVLIDIDKMLIAAGILSWSDAVDFHAKSLWMQYSVITASESWSTEIVNPNGNPTILSFAKAGKR